MFCTEIDDQNEEVNIFDPTYMKNNIMKINDTEEDEKQLTAKSTQDELLR